MRVVASVMISIVLSWSAMASVTVTPPLNGETIVGVWEGFLNGPPEPITLFRMQINAAGDSYLVQITLRAPVDRGASYTVYNLVPSDSKVLVGQTSTSEYTLDSVKYQITGTPIDLHFHQPRGEGLKDVRIKGIGVASSTQEFGLILCTSLGKDAVFFVKGSWTEDLGKASEGAKDAIKQLSK